MAPRGKAGKDHKTASSNSNSEAGSISPSSDSGTDAVVKDKGSTAPSKKRTYRKKPRDTDEDMTIDWLSNLLTDLRKVETGAADRTDDDVGVAASDSGILVSQSPPQNPQRDVLVDEAKALVEEAFGPIRNPVKENDEEEEDAFLHEVEVDSGLSEMQEREQKVLDKACEEFSKSSESKVKDSIVLEANLVTSINTLVGSGSTPEEAAEEVMLNHLIGNGFEFENSTDASTPNKLNSEDVATCSDTSLFSETLTSWLGECTLSLKALQLQSQAHQDKTVGQDGELSLAFGNVLGDRITSATEMVDSDTNSKSLFWIHWREPGSYGRPATLDRDNRVKCIVATGKLREPRDYRNVKILHPAIGVRMERVRGFRGGLRPLVSDPILRLHDMCQCAILAADESLQQPAVSRFITSATLTRDVCFICQTTDGPVGDRVDDMTSACDRETTSIHQCPVCLLGAHVVCCKRLLGHAQSADKPGAVSFPDDIDIETIVLPELLEPAHRNLGLVTC